MKKYALSFLAVCFALFFLLALAGPALAGGSFSTGEITSDSAAVTGDGWMTAIAFSPNGGDGTVIIYDNASAASGTVLYRGFVAQSSDYPQGRNWIFPVKYRNGLYVDLTTAKVIIEYRENPPN